MSKWTLFELSLSLQASSQTLKMSSKSSTFASFADTAAATTAPKQQTSFEITTVADLLEALNKMVKQNPDVMKMPVYTVEFGGLTTANNVSIDHDMLVIDKY